MQNPTYIHVITAPDTIPDLGDCLHPYLPKAKREPGEKRKETVWARGGGQEGKFGCFGLKWIDTFDGFGTETSDGLRLAEGKRRLGQWCHWCGVGGCCWPEREDDFFQESKPPVYQCVRDKWITSQTHLLIFFLFELAAALLAFVLYCKIPRVADLRGARSLTVFLSTHFFLDYPVSRAVG